MADQITCKQCDHAMHKTKRTQRSLSLQLIGVLVFLVGLVIAFAAFPIGTIIGVILMLVALGMGYKQEKVWLCNHCGYYFPRN